MADSFDITNHKSHERSLGQGRGFMKLKLALKYWCNIDQKEPHTALEDAKYVKMVAQAGAKRLGYDSYSAYLDKNWKNSTFKMLED